METVEDTSITEIVDKCDESSAPTTVTNPNGNGADIDTPLSKREQKKLHKLAQYEIRKKEKRRQDRIKSKEKRAEAAAKGLPGRTSQRKALKRNTMDNSKNSVRVAIDLDYEEQMSDKDIAKCSKQLLWVYTTNRKATMPIHLFYTSLKADSRMQESLSHNEGYAKWDIKFREESYLEAFEKASIVYLTSDSETVLDQLDPNSVYIIGGLVDHNHHKGLSLARAEKHGLKTARLPLGEHVCMKTRTVLTIVHGERRFYSFCLFQFSGHLRFNLELTLFINPF